MSDPRGLLEDALSSVARRTDRMFLWLLLGQWALALVLALGLSPYTWVGATRAVHFHVWLALGFGAVINALPVTLIVLRPGHALTRHIVAVAQALWSSALIAITGGRIETHFHIFGSLAFLAFYRDARVLATAAATVLLDHLARGLFWPDSVYGTANPEWWRFLEHGVWVAFEAVVLALGCARQRREMATDAARRALLEQTNARIEVQVQERIAEARELEVELRHAQKLESVGRLAAGVAHEINTPVQYVADSVQFVRETVDPLFAALAQHRAVSDAVIAERPARDLALAARAADEPADIEYLASEYPGALDRALDGLARVTAIVRSMRVFARQDSAAGPVDLNAGITSTLMVAEHQLKYVADVSTALGTVPFVHGHAGAINQVILNLVINAAHAIEDVVGVSGARGRITVTTRSLGDRVEITVSDTGAGIPVEVRDRIFDPFFTTKAVGRGTGQGLAIAHAVVVEKHGGTIDFESTLGAGTTFRITLPVEAPAALVAEAA